MTSTVLAEQALSAIAGLQHNESDSQGRYSFEKTTAYLKSAFAASCVMLASVSPSGSKTLRVLSLSSDSTPVYELNLAGSVFEPVLGNPDQTLVLAAGATAHYPADDFFRQHRPEACVIVPILLAGRGNGGVLALLFDYEVDGIEHVTKAAMIAAHGAGRALERRSAGSALANQDKRFRAFAESASDWFFEMDASLRFSYFSNRFQEITGVPPAMLLGKTRQETGIPDVDEAAWHAHLEALAQHKPFRDFTHPRTKEDGSVVWLSISAKPSFAEDGSFTGYYGVGRDITAIKNKQDELAEAIEAAESANRSKSEFLANMSHEIRTPMNGIMGMAELLSATELAPKQKTFADIILNSGSALLTIINDILDFSKIDAGEMTLDPEPFELVNTVEDVTTLVSSSAAEKDIELIVRIDPNLPNRLIGDAGRLRQIITNLVGNAIKFTNEGTVYVDVSAGAGSAGTPGQQQLNFQVKDTGIGIPEDRISEIFGKFSQVDGSATRKHGGTGLGLAISASLVEMMGGKLDVESQLDVGSRFFFSINLPVDGEEKAKPSPPKDLRGAKVLVVDDNEVNRAILTENLQAWNFDAAACSGAQQAQKILQAAHSKNVKIDLIILDYHMPEINGAQFAQAIRQIPECASIPIIMLTSVDQAADGTTFKSLGVEGHLSKPARSQALLDLIVDVLHKHETKLEIAEPQPEKSQFEEGDTWEADAFQPVFAPDIDRLDILIAEDNEVNRVVFTQILLDTTYSFKIAQNGREAIEFYEKYNPRLIFSDISMPMMDGFQLTEEIRVREKGDNRHTPVVGVTAYAPSTDAVNWERVGMDDFLTKPVSPRAMIEKADLWLSKSNQVAA